MTRTFVVNEGRANEVALDLQSALNEAQRAVVTCGSGPKLVIAGAGSGKTHTITYRVAYLLNEGLSPHQILLATFTNKAAREMLNRVERLVGSSANQVWGGTFHALGNRLLRQYGTKIGLKPNYSILDSKDQRDLIKLSIKDAKIKVEDKRFPSPAIIHGQISYAFNTRRTLPIVIETRAPHLTMWTEDIQRIALRYQAKKREANAVDYDDLLGLWLELLEQDSELCARLGEQFKCIIVDEYQDTSLVQSDIIERIAKKNGNNLMVVGDDAQSIYRFRGAHYDNILNFPQRNPGTEIFKLEVNYRSTPQILEFTNASILQNQRQYGKKLVADRESGSLPIVLPVNDVYQEAAFVAERILQLREEGASLNAIAVLYRAHAHSSILQAELMKRNVPYEVRSGMRFFEQAHIKDVLAYLKVLENPYDEMSWRRLLLMLPRIGNATAERLYKRAAQTTHPLQTMAAEAFLDSVPASARAYFERFQKDLRYLQSLAEQNTASEVVAALLETGYVEFMRANYEGYQSRVEDIQQLSIFARTYPTLRDFLTEMVLLGEMYEQEVDDKTDYGNERLVLSSVHQAKGLEWDTVFVLRMCEGEFPSERAMHEEEGEEEERRIFYVAATRARDELYLTHPMVDMSMRGGGIMQPSRFLREIKFTLYEQGEVRSQSRSWYD